MGTRANSVHSKDGQGLTPAAPAMTAMAADFATIVRSDALQEENFTEDPAGTSASGSDVFGAPRGKAQGFKGFWKGNVTPFAPRAGARYSRYSVRYCNAAQRRYAMARAIP